MGMIEWEPEVEYYQVDRAQSLLKTGKSYNEISIERGVEQDGTLEYSSTGGRNVLMRVLGYSAAGPVVEAVVWTPDGRIGSRTGGLIGCMRPKDSDFYAGVLRTNHLPVLSELGRSASRGLLPLVVNNLRIAKHPPRRV